MGSFLSICMWMCLSASISVSVSVSVSISVSFSVSFFQLSGLSTFVFVFVSSCCRCVRLVSFCGREKREETKQNKGKGIKMFSSRSRLFCRRQDGQRMQKKKKKKEKRKKKKREREDKTG